VSRIPIAALLLTLVCAACVSPPPQGSGFLDEGLYAQMRQSPHDSDVWIWTNPSRSLGEFQMVVIDEVEVRPAPGNVIEGRYEAEAEAAAVHLRRALSEALGARYPTVRRPMRQAMRIRAAITDVVPSQGPSLLGGTALDGLGISGATMEAEILDAMTGERVAAAIAKGSGRRSRSAEGIREWGKPRDVLTYWAESLKKRMDEAHNR
jgi:hypothetical protein